MPNSEFVLRSVVAKPASVATCSSRRSTPAVSMPAGSVISFCHAYCRCVVLNGELPYAVCVWLSSIPAPADSRDTQNGARRLRLGDLPGLGHRDRPVVEVRAPVELVVEPAPEILRR